MSADNFMLLRRHEDLFVVTMEFASDDEPRPIRQRPDGTFEGGMTRAFDNYADAHEYAHGEWTEYGVEDQTATDVVTEERRRIFEALSTKCPYEIAPDLETWLARVIGGEDG